MTGHVRGVCCPASSREHLAAQKYAKHYNECKVIDLGDPGAVLSIKTAGRNCLIISYLRNYHHYHFLLKSN